MNKTCKNLCEGSYKRFKNLHFKPKNKKNCAFINSTEFIYKKTCNRLCNPKQTRKKQKQKQKQKLTKTKINKNKN